MATRDTRSLDDVMETLGEARAPRQTREETKRVEVWAPASTLPEPDKQPGYAYRWIRVSTNGEKDPGIFRPSCAKVGNLLALASNPSLA